MDYDKQRIFLSGLFLVYDRDSLNDNYYKNIRMKKIRITLTEEELKYQQKT